MTLSAEQFNMLATKDDLKLLKQEIKEELGTELGGKMDQLLTVMDGIAKKHNDFEQELTFNQAAHDRMQGEINIIKKQVKQEA